MFILYRELCFEFIAICSVRKGEREFLRSENLFLFLEAT